MMRRNKRLAVSLPATVILGVVLAQTASAQFSSTSRTGSASGNALTNSTLSGSGSPYSGTGTSTSGFGGANSGMGNNALQQGANRTAGNGQSSLGQSLFNQNNNQNAFIGGRNNSQQFIGGNQRTGQQQNNRQQNNQFNNRQGRNNQDDINNLMNQQNQQADQRRTIRPQQKVAFEMPQRSETEVRSNLETRFGTLSQTPTLRGVTYDLDADGTVVLRGSVETPSQKRLAENVVRLEPGVKKVRNELIVGQPAARN